MIFNAIFEEIKKYLQKAEVSDVHEHIAVQVNLTGFGGGTFYNEIKDGKMIVEPYAYNGWDAMASLSVNTFRLITTEELEVTDAIESGLLKVDGNIEKLYIIWNKILKIN